MSSVDRRIHQLSKVFDTVRINQQNKLNRRLVKKMQDQIPSSGNSQPHEEDETMGDITLGDRTENHYHTAQQEKPKSSLSNLVKAGLIAGTLATGGGAGALAYSLLQKPVEKVIQSTEKTIEKSVQGTNFRFLDE